MEKFNLEIENIISSDSYLIIAVSSGPDSMCLLDIISKKSKKIVVAHVNYHKRKQSNQEEEYLKKYCYKNNLIFESLSVEKHSNNNFQQEARDIRYDFFLKLLNKYKTKYLFTAHHADDLIETILMRISRGSTLGGYAGFKQINNFEKNYIIRPLINWSKEEIIKYNHDHKIKYYIDESNLNNDYTRNKYRHNIVPNIKKENHLAHLKYLKYSEILHEANQYIDEQVIKEYKKIVKNQTINLDKLSNKHKLIQERIIMKILENIYDKEIILINSKNIKDIFSMIKSNKPNIDLVLPKHLHAVKSYDKLFFEFKNENDYSYSYILNNDIELINGKIIVNKIDNGTNDNYYLKLKSKNIVLPLKVRNSNPGDKIQIKNNKGHTKINRIFIDNKISTHKRRTWPIVTDSEDTILWIPGIKKSVFDEDNNFDIILKFIEKREENANKKE